MCYTIAIGLFGKKRGNSNIELPRLNPDRKVLTPARVLVSVK